MNKIVNINLGGYPFSIDEDAYGHLSAYLNSIHRHFEVSEGYDEITSDIEIRLAEIFEEHLGDRSIVTKSDVLAAISVMGTPEEFGAEPIEETTYEKTKIKTGKRLFRDPEDKVVGGVCSGLAAYLGVKDPLWIRILLVILVLSSVGFLIPAYLIAWAIVPEAKTAGDRLAMRGEPINASNIGKMVEEEMSNLSSKISEIGDNLSEEFKSQKKRIDGSGGTIRNVLAKIIYILGQVIRAIIETIGKLWRPLLMIVSFAIALAFVVMWIASAVGIFAVLPFTEYLVPDKQWIAYVGAMNVFTIVAIPMLSILMFLLRGWTRVRLGNYWRAGLGAFFVLNVVSVFGIGSMLLREFNTGADMTTASFNISSDTAYLSLKENLSYEHNLIRLFDEDVILGDDRLEVEQVSVDILQSENDEFYIEENVFSRGKSRQEANELAAAVASEMVINGNQVKIPSHISIPKGAKFRGQRKQYKIYVPEGKSVVFDHNINRRIHHFDLAEGQRRHWDVDDSSVWTMKKDGLVNTTHPEEAREERYKDYYGINRFQIEGMMNVDFYQADEYKIEVSTNDHNEDRIEFKKFNDQLFITASDHGPKIRISIGLPRLESLYAIGTNDITIEGFDQKKMNIDFNSQYELKLLSKVEDLSIHQKGRGRIDLIGEGIFLAANLSEESKMDTERFALRNANVKILENSWIRLNVSDTLRRQVDESGQIELKEEPKVSIRETL